MDDRIGQYKDYVTVHCLEKCNLELCYANQEQEINWVQSIRRPKDVGAFYDQKGPNFNLILGENKFDYDAKIKRHER